MMDTVLSLISFTAPTFTTKTKKVLSKIKKKNSYNQTIIKKKKKLRGRGCRKTENKKNKKQYREKEVKRKDQKKNTLTEKTEKHQEPFFHVPRMCSPTFRIMTALWK